MSWEARPYNPNRGGVSRSAAEAIAAFNLNPNRPFDQVGEQRVYHRARLPILAADCDYEIVSISGAQGRRLSA